MSSMSQRDVYYYCGPRQTSPTTKTPFVITSSYDFKVATHHSVMRHYTNAWTDQQNNLKTTFYKSYSQSDRMQSSPEASLGGTAPGDTIQGVTP